MAQVKLRAIVWLLASLAVPIATAAAHARRAPASNGEVTPPRDAEVSAGALAAGVVTPTPLVAMSLGAAEQGTPFASLPALRVSNARGTSSEVRLYGPAGRLDEDALRVLDDLLADARDAADVHAVNIDRRSLQLLFRAAYHFGAKAVQVVSGYRAPGRRSEGYHGEGKAIDFKLPGVRAAALASYLRTLPRVGVGVYTHARTQFVHLDVRERSFYWLDASPPGRTWRERPIRSASMGTRDASYRIEDDWPEGTRPAPAVTADAVPVISARN